MEDKDYIKALEGLIRNTEQNIITIREQISSLLPQERPYNSEVTKELDTALSKAQGDYPQIGYNKENPFFKSGYATLDHIMVRIRPILSKYGLSFVQQRRCSEQGETMLHSILKHSSGQWIESRSRVIPPKNDMQTLGSTLSYLKRYDGMALLGITVSEDASDDDAEVAMNISRKIEERNVGYKPPYDNERYQKKCINKEQLAEVQTELELLGAPEEADKLVMRMFDTFKIQELADIPAERYGVVLSRIRGQKERLAGRTK